jgi:SAM-dependent methyltransferase
MGGPTQAERHAHPLIPECSPDLFRGTAEYYTRFRPRYPAVLLDAISRTVDLDHVGSLVDLACGTGEVCFALADSVEEIWAIDIEPEMIAMARQNALDRGIGRIHWLVGRAEEADVPEDHFGLVATGRAFHRLNRPLIARQSLRWLRSGGHFIDLGADSSGLSKPSETWIAAVAEVYERWLPRARKSRDEAPSRPGPEQPKATTQSVLVDAGFVEVAKHEFPIHRVWEVGQFIGYLCSTSYSSREFWGDAWDGFESDLRAALTTFAPAGHLSETISSYFVVGRKP